MQTKHLNDASSLTLAIFGYVGTVGYEAKNTMYKEQAQQNPVVSFYKQVRNWILC